MVLVIFIKNSVFKDMCLGLEGKAPLKKRISKLVTDTVNRKFGLNLKKLWQKKILSVSLQ